VFTVLPGPENGHQGTNHVEAGQGRTKPFTNQVQGKLTMTNQGLQYIRVNWPGSKNPISLPNGSSSSFSQSLKSSSSSVSSLNAVEEIEIKPLPHEQQKHQDQVQPMVHEQQQHQRQIQPLLHDQRQHQEQERQQLSSGSASVQRVRFLDSPQEQPQRLGQEQPRGPGQNLIIPRRGKGILKHPTVGMRIPLCGKCQNQIRSLSMSMSILTLLARFSY